MTTPQLTSEAPPPRTRGRERLVACATPYTGPFQVPAVAWALQNDNVATAIIGASRPEQVSENVKAAGVRLEPELMARIDDVLGDGPDRDRSERAGLPCRNRRVRHDRHRAPHVHEQVMADGAEQQAGDRATRAPPRSCR